MTGPISEEGPRPTRPMYHSRSMSFWKRLLGRGKKGDTATRKKPAPKPKRDTKKRGTRKHEAPKDYPLANVGSLLKRAKADPDRVVAECTKALERNPGDVAALCCRALAYQARNDGDEAIRDAEAALEADSVQASSWVVRAVVRIAHRDLDGAIEDCAQAIELDPDYPEAYAQRAMALERKGELAAAKADYARSIDLQFRSSLKAEIGREGSNGRE